MVVPTDPFTVLIWVFVFVVCVLLILKILDRI